MNDLDSIIRKIEALITQADHPNTGPAEAETFRAKAEALMFKYRIEEMQIASRTEQRAHGSSLAPQWSTFTVTRVSSEWANYYYTLFVGVVRHFDCEYQVTTGTDDSGFSVYVAEVVGYESDLRFISILWQSIRLGFSSKLEPKFDSTISLEENAFNMRSAGMEGSRMAYALFGNAEKSNRVKARNMARSWAEKIGEDPSVFSGRGNDMETYRKSFASGFLDTLTNRLYAMKRSRNIEESGALVLASRTDAIKEALWERYPNRRPKPAIDNASESTVAQQHSCDKCDKAKSGYCREHSWMRPRRSSVSAGKYNVRAAERGRDAARSVNLGITERGIK